MLISVNVVSEIIFVIVWGILANYISRDYFSIVRGCSKYDIDRDYYCLVRGGWDNQGEQGRVNPAPQVDYTDIAISDANLACRACSKAFAIASTRVTSTSVVS